MIPNQWYAVLESREVRKGKLTGVTRMGENLVFWRGQNGQAACLRDQCAHRGAAFSKGTLQENKVRCPFHGFEYDGSGRCTHIPARGRNARIPEAMQVQTYPLREAHDFIWLWWGQPQEDYPPLPWFEDLDTSFSYGRDGDLWPVHYSRAIENQLDVFHLPFVHDTTIGRGNRVVADGPVTHLEDNHLQVWVTNRQENGQTGKMPREMSEPQGPALLHFLFPHIWMNRLSDDFRIVIAFVPVDNAHTRFYLRYYQRFVRLPILKQIVNWMTVIGSRVILRQDRRVVITQLPVKSWYGMPERLISADRPIIEYRRHREFLIDTAHSIQDETHSFEKPATFSGETRIS
jgi:phenylpropionate dioxygenase-like ring-hydroxylating dioxygenase large terminal subunit